MDQHQQSLETLQDIKRMMERSSRFISLSGWSGIAAGLCALAGAWLAVQRIALYKTQRPGNTYNHSRGIISLEGDSGQLVKDLFIIAAGVLVAAVILAFLFTYRRSRKNGVPIWGNTTKRLLWNTLLPLLVSGIVIVKILLMGYYLLVAPLCLVFYGLALVNGSKYTLGEVRYLGYAQIAVGLVNLFVLGYGLIFWAIGFGLLHIIYGIVMWWKYERNSEPAHGAA